MAHALVTEAMRRRLAELRRSKMVVQGIMLCPKMADSIEEWEEAATVAQERLIAETRDDPRYPVVEAAPEPMTADQERAFHHHMDTSRRQRKPMSEEQRVAQAYAKARGTSR